MKSAFPWMKFYPQWCDDQRLGDLANELDVPEWQALGALMWLLGWASKYAQDGIIRQRGVSTVETVVERAVRWQGEPGQLAAAFLSSTILLRVPDGLAIAEWDEQQGSHVAKFSRDRLAQEEKRAQKNRAISERLAGDKNAPERDETERETRQDPPPPARATPAASPKPDATAPKDPPPPPAVAAGTTNPFRPAQPAAPKQIAAPAPTSALPHPEVTYSEVRELWQAVRKRPGVRLREWPVWPTGKQLIFDSVVQQRPIEGPEGWRAVMDALAKSTLFNGTSPGTPDLLLDRGNKGTIASLLADHFYDEPEQPPAPKPDPHRDDQSRWDARTKAHFEEKARKAAEAAAKTPPNP